MTRIERTSDLFLNGGLNCAQAILTAFGEAAGIDADTARMLGRPLGGGVAAAGQRTSWKPNELNPLLRSGTLSP